MKKFSVILFVLCLIFTLTACNPSANSAGALRKDLEKHEFLGVTFYLPAEFTQSNIFADTDTGRISYTNPQGLTVLINVHETAFISQNFDQNISDAQSYAQVYYDSYRAENSEETPLAVEQASKFDVPYLRLSGNIDGVVQFAIMGFYCDGAYCACISVYTENESLFNENAENMINFATIATFVK